MEQDWNITGIVITLECIDDNDNYQEVECRIEYPKLIEHLTTLTKEDLLNHLNDKKEFYIPIIRSETYEVICSIDLELECENLFISIIDERLCQLIGNKKINAFTDNNPLFETYVEFDEINAKVIFKKYDCSESFKSLYTQHTRKKKIDSIFKNDKSLF